MKLRRDTFALTVLLAALSAIGPLTTDMYLPSLPDIARQLGASTAEAQLTISSYLVGFAIGQIIYGPVSDRHGRKPVLLGAIALYGAASLVCALSISMPMLITARAVQALGGCGGIVLARAIVRDLYSGARAGRELSVIGSVMGIAPVIAPIIGGALQTLFGWRSIFVTLVIAAVIGAGVVFLLLPETVPARAKEPVSVKSMLTSFSIVGRSGPFLAYLGLGALSYAGLFAWISGSPFVLQNLYHLPPFKFGIAFALGSAGFMSGSAIAARLIGPLGLDRVLGVGSVALAAGGLGMVGAVALGLNSAAWLVLPMAIYLAGMGMVLPSSIAGAMAPFPERAGAASSLYGFVQQSAAAICGTSVGVTLGKNAWPLAGAVAGVGCACLILWVFTRSVRARGEKH